MAFIKIDDRQIIQRVALTNSIGSAANIGLDSLFSQIDSVMANLAGVQTLTNKTLGFLNTSIITDAATTGTAATLPVGDITSGVVRLTNTSLTSVSGITAGTSSQFITIENQTGNTITVNNNDSSASVGNRIYTGTGTGIAMIANSTITLNYDSTAAHWMLQGITSGAKLAPTVQIFLSGSGTYTTPVGVLYLKVTVAGGGGGGSGAGNNSSTAGGTTTFGTSFLTATGGGLATTSSNSNSIPGTGGTASVAGGAITLKALIGGTGSGGSDATDQGGGTGGSNAFGGAGGGAYWGQNGYNGVPNSGAGGGGGGGTNTGTGQTSGAGGGAGGYIEAIITSPGATYAYAVGSGGAGSADVSLGGNGAAGQIIIEEFYQ